MKTRISSTARCRASVLVMVFFLALATLLVMGAVLQWSSTNVTLSGRNNEYYRSLSAAEAASEKVLGRLAHDYRENGEAYVVANVDTYRNLVPKSTENPIF